MALPCPCEPCRRYREDAAQAQRTVERLREQGFPVGRRIEPEEPTRGA